MDEIPSTSSQASKEGKATAESTSSVQHTTFTSELGETKAKVINIGGTVNFNESASRDERTEDQTISDCNELKQKLEHQARIECEIEQIFCLDHPSTIAPLQISEQQDPLSVAEQRHNHHRKERMQLISKPPVGNVSVKDLFAKAKELAENSSSNNHHTTTNEVRHTKITAQGNMVGIIGQAGSGKTILTKTILKKVQDDDLYGPQDFVFYLRFRDFDYNKETDLLSFLTPSIDLSWKSDSQRRNAVLNALAASDQVLIILDGFDEASERDKIVTSKHKIHLYSQAKPSIFIKHILQGNILPKAKKICTSRPRQLLQLPEDIRPHFIVDILGIDKIAQQQLCEDICSESSDEVFNYVQNRPDIASYCYVPLNCILVMHAIQKIRTLKSDFSNSLTGLFAVVLALFVLSSHMDEQFDMQKFANLAWNSFKENKFYLKERDLDAVGLKVDERNAFLVTTRSKTKITLLGGDTSKVCYFSHLLLQECLVAIHLLFFMTPSDFESLFVGKPRSSLFGEVNQVYDLTGSKFEMITKFLFGFCNDKTFSFMKQKFDSLILSPERVQMLQSFALKHSSEHKRSMYRFGSDPPVFAWAYEMNDNNLTYKLARSLPPRFRLCGQILPSDVMAIHHVLRARKDQLILSVGLSNPFVGESFQIYLKEMKTTIKSTPLLKIHLTSPDIGIDDDELATIASFVDKVEKLPIVSFAKNPITIKGLAALFAAIQKRPEPMNHLAMIGCKIGDGELIAMSSCISNLEGLMINNKDDNQLTITAGITALTEAVRKLTKPMRLLDLSGCKIGDDGFLALSSCIGNIKILKIRGPHSQLSMKGVTALSNAVQKLHTPMDLLDLDGCEIGDDGFLAMSSCISNIKNLRIKGSRNQLSMKGITALSNAVQKLHTPMDYLNLDGCEIGDDGFLAMSSCISNIKNLRIKGSRNQLTMKGITALSNAVQKLHTPMNWLDLSGCEIGDDGFLAMSSCISNIKSLSIYGSHNHLSMKGITALSNAVQKLQSPMGGLTVRCDSSMVDEASKELERCQHKCTLAVF